MKDYIEERTIDLANYIINNKATVRDTAKKYGISKSTVHNDITLRLVKIDGELANKVQEVLIQNKNERHIRGGQATKEKYMSKAKNKSIEK